jgi:LacI family transcriptional regulator
MNKAPTLKDVARLAGVHPGTVSKALSPRSRREVSPSTVEIVLEAARELGYHPDPIARSLRTKRSNVVGIILPDLTNPVFPPAVRGIEDALREHGYTALIASTDNDLEREAEIFRAMQGRRVDGFIIATARRQHPLLRSAVEDGVPLVQLNRVTDDVDAPAVLVDDTGGMRTAVDHLLQLGHRRLVHLAGPSDLSTAEVRRQAFLTACERHGDAVEEARVVECDAYSIDSGARATRKIFRQAASPSTGVLAGNDLIALGTYQVCREMGKDIPRDVSVVGFNDMPFVDMFQPALTTVHVPQYQIGLETARLLLERLENDEAMSKHVLLPSRLVVRGSTGPAPSRGKESAARGKARRVSKDSR